MPDHDTQPLHLTRVDPARNMARFYAMAVQPTLFGEVALVRTWGRIGRRGQAMMVTFADVAEATAALARLERQKRGRGYCSGAGWPRRAAVSCSPPDRANSRTPAAPTPA